MGLISRSLSTEIKRGKKFPPIELKIHSKILYENLLKFLDSNEYEIIESSAEFLEICANKNNISYSFSISSDNSRTIINVLIFKRHFPINKRKYLLKILDDLKVAFAENKY